MNLRPATLPGFGFLPNTPQSYRTSLSEETS